MNLAPSKQGLLAALVLLGLGGTAARADVVLATPATLSADLAAASDGDIVLVKPGTYLGEYVIDGKDLTLVADASAPITLPRLTIRNLPDGATVFVRGFQIGDSSPLNASQVHPSLEILDGAGTAWIEDVLVIGHDGADDPAFPFVQAPGSTAGCVRAATAVFERSQLVGGQGGESIFLAPGLAGGVGLELAAGARTVLQGGSATGGQAGNSPAAASFPPNLGGDGIHGGEGAFLALAGTMAIGGNGAQGAATGGGDGCCFAGGTGSIWRRDTFIIGGTAFNGNSGAALEPGLASVTEFSAGAGSLAIDSPLREGQSGTIAIDAPADATAWLLFAPTAAYTPLFARQGVLAPSPTALFLVPIGGTGPTGSLSLPFAAPQLPSGVDGLVVPFQLALSTAAGTTLDGASLLVVVDATIP